VRTRLKEVEDATKKLEKIQKEKHSKLKTKQKIPGVKVSEEKVQKDAARKQVVDLTFKHLEDLRWREQNPGQSRVNKEQLIADNSDDESGERAVVGGIPDIDDPQFELLRKQDEEIDAELDVVLAGVRRLKALAQQAGEEIDNQQQLLEDLDTMAEEQVAQLETANRELAKTLKKVRSARNLCCDIIIIAVILGVAVAIYFLATK